MAKQVQKNRRWPSSPTTSPPPTTSCNPAVTAFKNAGINVSYVDHEHRLRRQRHPRRRAHEGGGRRLRPQLHGRHRQHHHGPRRSSSTGSQAKQLWLNGNDQSMLNQYQDLMQGVYFNIRHVPFSVRRPSYPGAGGVLSSAMKKYEPSCVYDEVALQGWQSAALLVAGVKAAGQQPDPAQRHHASTRSPTTRPGGSPLRSTGRARGHNEPITTYPVQRLHPGQGQQVRDGAHPEATGLRLLRLSVEP